ncbi:MAG: ribonuclease HI [Desulfovibrionaceae bacterium]|nr:ribonuclease HI [Desulfovibrionaceae bacterium]
MKEMTIYTDGSCLGNPGSGGWAAIIVDPLDQSIQEISGGFKLTTNNRMEMISIIKALETLTVSCKITLYSDSEYVCNAFNKGWLAKWIKNRWVKSDKKPVKNIDLWKLLLQKKEKHEIQFIWVKGHAGHPQNERCDELAQTAAQSSDWPEDLGYLESN